MNSIQAAVVGSVGTLTAIAAVMILSQPGTLPATQYAAQQAASPELTTTAQFHTDFGGKLTAASCDGTGQPVVNISERIKNDADSGTAGNYWGLDDFTRTIQVWQTKYGSYCAVVKYEGSFSTFAGQTSPGGTGTLSGNERGTVVGGYIATITGTLKSSPAWQTKGNVGTVDYQCDSTANCPGAINWLDQYFNADYTFNQPVWGWVYTAGHSKAWANTYTGSTGDII